MKIGRSYKLKYVSIYYYIIIIYIKALFPNFYNLNIIIIEAYAYFINNYKRGKISLVVKIAFCGNAVKSSNLLLYPFNEYLIKILFNLFYYT